MDPFSSSPIYPSLGSCRYLGTKRACDKAPELQRGEDLRFPMQHTETSTVPKCSDSPGLRMRMSDAVFLRLHPITCQSLQSLLWSGHGYYDASSAPGSSRVWAYSLTSLTSSSVSDVLKLGRTEVLLRSSERCYLSLADAAMTITHGSFRHAGPPSSCTRVLGVRGRVATSKSG